MVLEKKTVIARPVRRLRRAKSRLRRLRSGRACGRSGRGNPPDREEPYRKAPGRMGFAAIFGGNRYLVPFNRGIATTSVRTGLAMTAFFQTPICRAVPLFILKIAIPRPLPGDGLFISFAKTVNCQWIQSVPPAPASRRLRIRSALCPREPRRGGGRDPPLSDPGA